MQTFSRRNNLRSEYSGYGEAALSLRNRLLQLYGMPYSGNERHFGIGNTNWIHEISFGKELQMHFGKVVPIEYFRDSTKTTFSDVFDFIELYYRRGKNDLDYRKIRRLYDDIVLAFDYSGSVYEFNKDGVVVLRIDESSAGLIAEVDEVLNPFQQAQSLYRESIDGLITRSKHPENIVGDMYIVLEDYLKRVTQKDSYEKAIAYLKVTYGIHSTQTQVIEKLRAYRGDVWGPAHAGNGKKPDEGDALWYLESIITQIRFVDGKIK